MVPFEVFCPKDHRFEVLALAGEERELVCPQCRMVFFAWVGLRCIRQDGRRWTKDSEAKRWRIASRVGGQPGEELLVFVGPPDVYVRARHEFTLLRVKNWRGRLFCVGLVNHTLGRYWLWFRVRDRLGLGLPPVPSARKARPDPEDESPVPSLAPRAAASPPDARFEHPPELPTSIPPPPPPPPPPDWYPDPFGHARLRYWDGATWTSHTA